MKGRKRSFYLRLRNVRRRKFITLYVLVHPKAIPGTYKVSFSIYSKGRVTDVARVLRYRVLLTVVTPDGTTESINTTEGPMRPYVFSDREFVPRPDKLYHMVDIVIGADGSVSLGGGDR